MTRSLTLYPAIDLKDGACVRLVQGDMNAARVYAPDPGLQATAFADAGFRWLHVVDLNGAVAGEARNAPAVLAILRALEGRGIPVQLGGGIRTMDAIERWLEAGIARVILGTVAAKDPQLVRDACKRFPGRIVVGIDARDGFVATEGWVQSTTMTARDLGLAFEDAGVEAIVFTDIARDGLLKGINLEATVALAQRLRTPVIASGGAASVADIEALASARADGIEGVILGRALYDGRIVASEALAAAA